MATIEFLEGTSRPGVCGRWVDVIHPDGRRASAIELRIDPTDAGAAGALVARVRAIALQRLPGIAGVDDVVLGGGRLWQLVSVAHRPTLRDAIDAEVLTIADSALIVADIGQTLTALHRAGLHHGAVGVDSIVISRTGSAVLLEAALVTGSIEEDVRALCSVMRALASHMSEEESVGAADLRQCADVAAFEGLPAAMAWLARDATSVDGFGSRLPLAATVRDLLARAEAAAVAAEAAPAAQAAVRHHEVSPPLDVDGDEVRAVEASATDAGDPAAVESVAGDELEVSTVEAPLMENPPTGPRTAPPRKSRPTKTTWEPLLPPESTDRPGASDPTSDPTPAAESSGGGRIVGAEFASTGIAGTEFADASPEVAADAAADTATDTDTDSTPLLGDQVDGPDAADDPDGPDAVAPLATDPGETSDAETNDAETGDAGDAETSDAETSDAETSGDETNGDETNDGETGDGEYGDGETGDDFDGDTFDTNASDPGELAKAGATTAVVAGMDDDDDEDSGTPAPGYKVTVRFGPGVPADGSKDVPARRRLRARRPRWSRIILNVAIAVVILAGATGYAVWHFNRPVNIDSVTVGLNQNLGTSCDVNVDVVGTIVTSGAPGVVTYQWKRDDGETSPVQKHSTTGDQPIVVHLHWMFSGPGKATGVVTLLVLKPEKKSARTSIGYDCASLPVKK